MSKKLILPLLAIIAAVGIALFWVAARPSEQSKDETVAPALQQRIAAAVETLPGVQELKAAIEQGGRSSFEINISRHPDDDKQYLVQVYELLSDHTATFGWYRYNPQDGTLIPQK